MAVERMTWGRLWPGLLCAAAVVAIALGVLLFARIGALHGETYHLAMATEGARGVIKGTEVWLEGQKIGLVHDLQFGRITRDTTERLLLDLELLEEYKPLIRKDSHVQIRSGGSLIGAPVVYISTGTAAARVLEEGEVLRSKPQIDAEALASTVALASREFPEIIANVRQMNAHLKSATSVIIGSPDDGGVRLKTVGARASRFTRRATKGQGTFGLALGDRRLAPRIGRAMARADSITTLLGSDKNVLGRFRRDSSLLREIADVRNEASILARLLAEPRGSAGRFVADSAIVRRLQELQAEMKKLFDDIRKDPFRYVAF